MIRIIRCEMTDEPGGKLCGGKIRINVERGRKVTEADVPNTCGRGHLLDFDERHEIAALFAGREL